MSYRVKDVFNLEHSKDDENIIVLYKDGGNLANNKLFYKAFEHSAYLLEFNPNFDKVNNNPLTPIKESYKDIDEFVIRVGIPTSSFDKFLTGFTKISGSIGDPIIMYKYESSLNNNTFVFQEELFNKWKDSITLKISPKKENKLIKDKIKSDKVSINSFNDEKNKLGVIGYSKVVLKLMLSLGSYQGIHSLTEEQAKDYLCSLMDYTKRHL